MRRLVLLCACALGFGVASSAERWTWITAPEDGPALAFERTFDCPADVTRAVLRHTSLGVSETTLNGRRVGDVELKPGFTCEKTREFHEDDVTALLKPGKANRLFAEVSDAYWRDLISGDPSLVGKRPNGYAAELCLERGSGECVVIRTGPDWRVATNGTLVSGGIYEGETRDMTRDAPDWRPAKAFEPAVEVVPARGGVRIRADLARPAKVQFPFTVCPGERKVVDFGQNAAAREVFTVTGPRGCRLQIRHAEVVNGDGTCYFDNLRRTKALTTYVMKGGELETFRPRHTYYGFRYAEITASAPVEFLSLAMEPVSSVRDETASLVTSDPLVNRIVSCAEWSLRSNQTGVPTDCCNRGERLGWMGDACASAPAACWLWDAREFYLGKVARDQRDLQRGDGRYCSLSPGRGGEVGEDKYGITAWSDAGLLIPYGVYRHFGLDARMGAHYPSMAAYGAWLEQSGGPFAGYWGDWLAFQRTGFGEPRYPYGSDPATYAFLCAAYRVRDFRALADMAAALGKDADAQRFAADGAAALKQLHGKFFAGGRLRREYACQTTYALLLAWDLCPNEASRRATADDLELNVVRSGRRLMTGVLGTPVLLEALSENGKEKLAYDLLLNRTCPSWGYMVEHGATTLWERWDGIQADGSFYADPKMNSFNHADFACVLDWMYRTMAGIRPNAQTGGFDSFVLAPRPDRRIRTLEAKYRAPKGTIRVKSEFAADGSWSYSYDIPAGTEAELRLPDGTRRTCRESGRVTTGGRGGVSDDPRIFRGDARTAFRDPAAVWHEGVFHLYFTLVETEPDSTVHSYVAHAQSRDLRDWTSPEKITPKSDRDYSSPGNVVRDGDEWVLCLQSYPRPGNRDDGRVRYADESARIFTMRSRDLVRWSKPELLRVKGPDVPERDMGRMIDPYLIRKEGWWFCFYKQNGASSSRSRDLRTWDPVGRTQAGENVCVVRDDGCYWMLHSPANGLRFKRSSDLLNWTDVSGEITLRQRDWAWARGRLTAGFLLDARSVPGVGKWVLFFHGSGPKTEDAGDFDRNASIGLALADSLADYINSHN